MRFVPLKTAEQQALLVVHRLRATAMAEHTRSANQIRGLLAEFGIVVPQGPNTLKRQWATLRQAHAHTLPALVWAELDALFQHWGECHQKVLSYDRKINAFVKDDERAQRLSAINGIGPITASAIVATIGNGQVFKNGRQFAAWLGLTPRQYSTGGKMKLGYISKRGDVYLRTLLVYGARSELRHTARRHDHKSLWAERLKQSNPGTRPLWRWPINMHAWPGHCWHTMTRINLPEKCGMMITVRPPRGEPDWLEGFITTD